ncbi:MAG TPA: phosphocholine cytidylyltransferase family protein [Ohtaekwangia sp.]|nr:phosphocholine cytidylyltransferase family protein [Ohtaekwangia sp.]
MEGKKHAGIILAAGRGSRLKELSLEQPKPMIMVNEMTIISNLVNHLINGKMEQIVIIVGYKAERLKEHLAPFHKKVNLIFIENSLFDTTNNIYSLWLAKHFLLEGFFLFEADVFIEESIVHDFINTQREDAMLVDKFTPKMNGTVVNFDAEKKVLGMYLNKDQEETFNYSDKFKTVNFYKISHSFAQSFFIDKLDQHIAQKDTASYYELIIKEAIESNHNFYAIETGNRKWYEIDTHEDLVIAQNLFNPR